MFKREIWEKFTEFTFLKFWNLPSETREISKFQKMNQVNFPQISRINMRLLVNHMWQSPKEHTSVRITQKQSININKFNKHNSITPAIKIFSHEIFQNSQFQKYNCNSTHSYNSKIRVGIPSDILSRWYYATFNFWKHAKYVRIIRNHF